MDISEIVNIILSILSFALAVTSIIIVVITLKQNNKMLEESSRPVMSIFTQTLTFGSPEIYLVVKNYGHSSAFIESLIADFDFTKCCKIHDSKNHIEDLYIIHI